MTKVESTIMYEKIITTKLECLELAKVTDEFRVLEAAKEFYDWVVADI